MRPLVHSRYEVLMIFATLQPIDSLMNSMRQCIPALHHASHRAQPGPSYVRSYYLIDVVLSQLWIYLLHRNYRLRIKTRQDDIPAPALGLMTDKQASRERRTIPEDDFLATFLTFLVGLNHARRLSQLTHGDAVAGFYLEQNESLAVPWNEINVSASRATAMLLTFCGILQEVNPIAPVQCLTPRTSPTC